MYHAFDFIVSSNNTCKIYFTSDKTTIRDIKSVAQLLEAQIMVLMKEIDDKSNIEKGE